MASSMAQPITRREQPSRTAHKYSQPSKVISDVHTRFSTPVSKRRLTRSLGAAASRSTTVVAGANRRGLIPASPWRRSEAATVLRDTRWPSARRSARMRGVPYTPSDALWNAATLASSSARRRCAVVGPASRVARHL
jgi:hypothetical protein